MPLNFFKKKKIENDSVLQPNIAEDLKPNPENQETILQNFPNDIKHVNPDIAPIEDMEKKKKDIKRKKRRFIFFAFIFLLSLLVIIFTPTAIDFYKKNFIKAKPIVQEVSEEDRKPEIEVIDPESIVEYRNDVLKLSLEHLRKASLSENTGDNELTKKIEIFYDKNNGDVDKNLENLTEGYIFRISVFSTTLRKLDEVTQVRKDSFTTSCPETAQITNTIGIDIDGIEGRTFEVNNCGADYKVSYLVKDDLNYEFAQIFKGDLGYRQAYKAETENIMRSIKFYPEEEVDLGPVETYNSEQYGLSFEYPRSLDTTCCNITGPISVKSVILLTLGEPQAFVESTKLSVIGFFVDNNTVGDFNSYLEKQKNLLTDDYVVAIGESPKPEIRTIKVGDKEGTMLKGYSWKKNDLIYVDISKDEKGKPVLVISIKNVTGDGFEDIVKSILESFKFF